MKLFKFGVLILVPALGFGISYASSGSATNMRLELTPCRVEGVEGQARCGVYQAPENRDKPNGRTLPLKVVVLPALSGRSGKEPVFYFEGGPGEAATKSADYVATLSIREKNDVVLVDQRGTGEGHRLDCKLPGSDTDLQGYLEPVTEHYKVCAKELAQRVDLPQYVTPVAMRDIDEIRQALGYDKINLYGGSYGSRAAIIYSKLFGKHVRSAYLSAVAPLDIRMPLYFAWSAQRALDAKLAECAADPECARDYPDPKGDLDATRERLRREPAQVVITHPVTGAAVKVSLNERSFAEGLFGKLYVAEDARAIPALLRSARSGDFKAFTQDAVERVRDGRSALARGMHRIIVCNEDVARIAPEEIDRETSGTFIGSYMAREAIDGCSAWPKGNLPHDFFEPFRSDIPVLITSGEYDPVTPARWGEAARKTFPNSMHIVANFGHSGFSETACLGAINRQFLAKASVQGLDVSCTQAPSERLRILP